MLFIEVNNIKILHFSNEIKFLRKSFKNTALFLMFHISFGIYKLIFLNFEKSSREIITSLGFAPS